MDHASYMDEIESYDPKGIRFFYALKLLSCEILPGLKPQDISILIQSYFTKLDQTVVPGDYKHHLGMICLALLPYCEEVWLKPQCLRILMEIYWELFHKSSQHEVMNLTFIKELFINRLFGLLVSTHKMQLLLPYFLEVDKESDFYGESVKVWLNMALDFFTPPLVEQLFHQDNIEQIASMLVMPLDESSIELPTLKLKLLHKLIYMFPPELLANSVFDQIWQSVYQEMKQADDSEDQIGYLSLLLVLSMRLPAEKFINYFKKSPNDIVVFIMNCFGIAMNYPEYMNLMTMVVDIFIQRLFAVDNSVILSFIAQLYLDIANNESLRTKNLNCFLWIVARVLPAMPDHNASEAVKWCNKMKVEISISNAEVPRTFLKTFAFLNSHIPKDIYTHFYPMAMISIGQIINVDTKLENLLEPLDDLILLHLSSISPEFSSLFFTLIMKVLIDVIKNVDYQDENESILGNKAMGYFVEMLNSCNNVETISKYMFSVLPQFLQYYPKAFEKICQGIMFAKKNTTLDDGKWQDSFSKNIENSLTKIIVILCQSPCYRRVLFAELLKHLKPGAPNNISIYLLGSLLVDDDANSNNLSQFQQYLNDSEKTLIQILSDTNWYMTVPPAISHLGGSKVHNIDEKKLSKIL